MITTNTESELPENAIQTVDEIISLKGNDVWVVFNRSDDTRESIVIAKIHVGDLVFWNSLLDNAPIGYIVDYDANAANFNMLVTPGVGSMAPAFHIGMFGILVPEYNHRVGKSAIFRDEISASAWATMIKLESEHDVEMRWGSKHIWSRAYDTKTLTLY